MRDYTKYTGKHYEAGIQDCFTLVREVYSDFLEVELTNYARPTGWEAHPEFNFFEQLYAAEGFECPTNNVNDLREGDCLLMAVASTKVNHVAMYIGKNQILHHLLRRSSVIEPYSFTWKNRVRKVLRHKNREAKLCREGSQLTDLLPEHLRLRLARRMEGSDV